MQIKVVIPTIRNAKKAAKALNHEWVEVLDGTDGVFKTLIKGMSSLDYDAVMFMTDDYRAFKGWQEVVEERLEGEGVMMFNVMKKPGPMIKETTKTSKDGFYSRRLYAKPSVFTLQMAKDVISRVGFISNPMKNSEMSGEYLTKILQSHGLVEYFVYNKKMFKEI